MKVLLWLLTLFTLAVGISLAAHYNQGYVLLVMPPYRAEISLNLAVLLAVLGFVAFHVLLRTAALTPAPGGERPVDEPGSAHRGASAGA